MPRRSAPDADGSVMRQNTAGGEAPRLRAASYTWGGKLCEPRGHRFGNPRVRPGEAYGAHQHPQAGAVLRVYAGSGAETHQHAATTTKGRNASARQQAPRRAASACRPGRASVRQHHRGHGKAQGVPAACVPGFRLPATPPSHWHRPAPRASRMATSGAGKRQRRHGQRGPHRHVLAPTMRSTAGDTGRARWRWTGGAPGRHPATRPAPRWPCSTTPACWPAPVPARGLCRS